MNKENDMNGTSAVRLARSAATLAILLFAGSAWAAPDFKAMLKEVDLMGSFAGKDVSVTYSVVDYKPGEPESYFQWSFFRRDDRDDMVMLTLKPESKAGEGILKIGDDVFMYQSDVGWTHHSMSRDIQGSKAKASDFRGSSLSDDYDIVETAEATLGKFDAWVLTLKAKTVEVSYDWIKVWIRKDKPVLLKMENYSQAAAFKDAQLLRIVTYPPRYVEVAGKTIPVETLMEEVVGGKKTGKKTVLSIAQNPNPKVAGKVEYLIAVGFVDERGRYSDKLPDSTFTKAFIEKGGKR